MSTPAHIINLLVAIGTVALWYLMLPDSFSRTDKFLAIIAAIFLNLSFHIIAYISKRWSKL